MNSSNDNWRLNQLGCPIRKSTDQRLLAASRGLSQLAASFIACWHQGIHRIALSSLITKVTIVLVLETTELSELYCPSNYLCVVVKEPTESTRTPDTLLKRY